MPKGRSIRQVDFVAFSGGQALNKRHRDDLSLRIPRSMVPEVIQSLARQIQGPRMALLRFYDGRLAIGKTMHEHPENK